MFKRINIEISNVCNLQCSFCPEVHRDKKRMSVELFRKIIAQAAPLTEEVCLHLMGEPMGHPQLSEIVDLCAEYRVPVNLTTNGTLMDERRREILLRPIVRQVNFSVQSFEANFGEKDVAPYLSKIFAFTRSAFERRPELYINYRLWDFTESGASRLESAGDAAPATANLRVRQAIEAEFGFKLEPGQVDLRRRKGYRISGRLYLNLDSRFEWPSMERPFRSAKGYCHALSNHFGIHADGTVVPCCLDKEAELKLGNCEDQPLAQILGSARAMKIAQGFARGECVESLCQECDFIKRFDRKAQQTFLRPESKSLLDSNPNP